LLKIIQKSGRELVHDSPITDPIGRLLQCKIKIKAGTQFQNDIYVCIYTGKAERRMEFWGVLPLYIYASRIDMD
jgi:hypothetical protein